MLSLDNCNTNRDINGLNSTTTAVSVAELPSDITDSLNVAAKQLSLLYERVVNSTEQGEELVDNLDVNAEGKENVIFDGIVEPSAEEETGRE